MRGNRFGRIISGFQCANAIRETVRVWMPDYIADVAEDHGYERGEVSTFKSYFLTTDLDRFDERQLPSMVLYIPDTPEIHKHAGMHTATWDVRLGCFVKGQDNDNSIKLAMMYVAAVRAIMVQQSGLGGDPRLEDYEPFASRVGWEGERYDLIDVDDSRTLGAAVGMFAVTADGVVRSGDGPTEPSGDPSIDPGPWPTVDPDKINVTVERDPL